MHHEDLYCAFTQLGEREGVEGLEAINKAVSAVGRNHTVEFNPWSLTMTDIIDAFPQHRAGKRKPTVTEIVIDAMSTKMPPIAMLQKIASTYPNVTQGEITAAIVAAEAEAAKRQRELGSMKALMTVVKPIMREPGHKGLTTGQALKIAADRGDARAKPYLAHFDSDEANAWERDFEAAVALDPYWEMSEDGRSATRKPGARHKTAEDLVSAYRANQLGNDAAD
jgi:hypothetical protein